MKHLLTHYYDLPVNESVLMNGNTGFRNNDYSYFITQANNNKAIQMEQTVLAHYLHEVGYRQMALPIQNREGEWITPYHDDHFMVVQVENMLKENVNEHGARLAQFHQTATAYPFEPTSISSYGQWKDLWIEKLTQLEMKVESTAKEKPSNYFRLVLDLLPYLIGISENAIQYMQETEQEQRFDLGDQATITFFRYEKNIIDQIIWPSDLSYDHPVRDIAEYIRTILLKDDNQAVDQALDFLYHYQSVQILSPFSLRLLYARLLFPVHIFDQIASYFVNENKQDNESEIKDIIEKQPSYEKNISRLFDEIKRNNNQLHIPMLHWL